MTELREREPVPPVVGEHSVAIDGADKQRFREGEWWEKRGYLLSREVEKLVKVNQVAKAIGLVIREFTAVAIVHDRDQQRVHVRVAALEPKPRVRVPAIYEAIP